MIGNCLVCSTDAVNKQAKVVFVLGPGSEMHYQISHVDHMYMYTI